MESIIQEIFGDTLFEEKERAYMCQKLKKRTLEKGMFLLRPRKDIKDIFYVHNGCLRAYCVDAHGREHTLQFAIKGWWISDYIVLFGKENKGAISYIECIKEATLIQISKKDFDALCKEIPNLAFFYIKKLESAFAAFHKRILGNSIFSAKERYRLFLKNYPDIEQNVKNYHIASFLGITTESLSRIRKEISTH